MQVGLGGNFESELRGNVGGNGILTPKDLVCLAKLNQTIISHRQITKYLKLS